MVMVGIAVLALGTGPLFALGTGLVVGSVPPERAGSAASMSETGNYFGGSLGLALLGAIGAGVYRGHMADAVAAGDGRYGMIIWVEARSYRRAAKLLEAN